MTVRYVVITNYTHEHNHTGKHIGCPGHWMIVAEDDRTYVECERCGAQYRFVFSVNGRLMERAK